MDVPTEGQVVVEEPRLETEDELWQETGAGAHEGWYCVRTSPFPCPAAGCDFIAEFMTAAHLILVWEAKDDPNLLDIAHKAQQVGRSPQIVPYEPAFGPSASYYAWEAAGRPVHGIRERT